MENPGRQGIVIVGSPVASVTNLSKRFGKKLALDNFTLSMNKGEIVGLVGPNGSGKTTLLNLMMGMLKPSSGSVNIGATTSVGMSVSRKGFFGDMTVLQNIKMYSTLEGADGDQVSRVLENFSIDFEDLQFSQLSAGMKQRVSLVVPFVIPKQLILLDEPSNHLDIDSLLALRQIVLERRKAGVSFLITSHILSDLEKTCDRLVFIKDGVAKADMSTADLIQKYNDLETAYLDIVRGNGLS